MGWTDRHCRFLHRLISPNVLLYSEMVTARAILHGDKNRLLGFDDRERPPALQLGGSNPAELAKTARIGEDIGYDEINLNCGCPSDRVRKGAFGASLMMAPDQVADCVRAMTEAVDIPVTVKARTGVDEQNTDAFLWHFVETVAKAGCSVFIIHARKCLLSGLSPRENRETPPLDPERVYRLKRDFPELAIIYNGGIKTVNDIRTHLAHTDGVMIGRAAYHNPWLLAEIEKEIYGRTDQPSRHEVIASLADYAEEQAQKGVPVKSIARHALGLFAGCRGGRAFRRHLAENAHKDGAGPEVLYNAAHLVLSDA